MVKLDAVLLVKLNSAEEYLPVHLRFAPEGWWNWPQVYESYFIWQFDLMIEMSQIILLSTKEVKSGPIRIIFIFDKD
jgi:hypothetical protein